MIDRAVIDPKIESLTYRIAKNRAILGMGLTRFLFAYREPHFADVGPLLRKDNTYKMLENKSCIQHRSKLICW